MGSNTIPSRNAVPAGVQTSTTPAMRICVECRSCRRRCTSPHRASQPRRAVERELCARPSAALREPVTRSLSKASLGNGQRNADAEQEGLDRFDPQRIASKCLNCLPRWRRRRWSPWLAELSWTVSGLGGPCASPGQPLQYRRWSCEADRLKIPSPSPCQRRMCRQPLSLSVRKVSQPVWFVTSTLETAAGAAVVAETVAARRSARSSSTNTGSMIRE